MTSLIRTKLNASRFQSIEDIEAELQTVLPWLFQPAFKINTREGFDGSAFGARAGPWDSISVYNCIHEVSHALDMTLLPEDVWKVRVRKPHFDMRIRSFQDIGDQRIYEPVTLQATKRECSVGGIQLRLLEAGGYDTSGFIERYVFVLRHMADALYGGSCPLNKPNRKDYDRKNWKWVAKRTQWVHDAYNAHSLTDLQNRWDAVMECLAQPRQQAQPKARPLELLAA